MKSVCVFMANTFVLVMSSTYQIRARPNSKYQGEDKNLGRWVNRQRSMYQAGRLRKDRQIELEKIGLKWSMLAMTPWDAMFETLGAYMRALEKDGKSWGGNVPACYRTDDNRALGRWVNRQRSAFAKSKLKKEYVDRLNAIGLKWSVHERDEEGFGAVDYNDDAGYGSEASDIPHHPLGKDDDDDNSEKDGGEGHGAVTSAAAIGNDHGALTTASV
jgi:hypothetical protein